MLRFVTALTAEARPLVERFALRRDPAVAAFPLYRGDEVALIVSGIGKAAAAAATSYLHLAAGGADHAVWLNVGIAGHGTLPVGEAVLASKVRDRATGACWYPPLLFDAPCARAEVVTVDRPESGFAEDGAHEMEASGFYPTACRFATAEVVHCLKVVSDGPAAPAAALTEARVVELLTAALPTVAAVVAACAELAAEARRLDVDPPGFADCRAGWRFTVTEARQLRRLLRRRQTLAPEAPLPLADLDPRARGGEVNRRLSAWLEALPVRL